jgi:SAM-dependent methyltransferase
VNPVLRWVDAVNRAHPWSHNDHYLPWVLRQVPPGATRALDVGCGTGTLMRALARRVPQVEGIDADPELARTAGAMVGDVLDLPAAPRYDVVTAVAVLHHLPLRPAVEHLTALLRPGGRLIVVGCYRPATLADRAVDVLAIPANLLVGLAKTRHAPAARIAMSAPTAPPHDTLADIRAAFPTATPRRRLFWRYTLVRRVEYWTV